MHANVLLTTTLFTLITLTSALPRRLPFPLPPILPRQNTSTCDLASTAQPASTLPAPAAGLSLLLIAHGTGFQNYTCSPNNASAVPVAIGAVATLVNASCSTTTITSSSSAAADVVGMHFFVDTTTPDFLLPALGNTELKKAAAVSAPQSTDVPWLQLQAQAQGTTSGIQEVYRLSTQGGVAPATCEGQGELVRVAYQAQYWFYGTV